jgi:CPA2 family monovalent cation:H+ antiporter-2
MHDLHVLQDLLIIYASAIVVALVVARFGLPSIAGLTLAGALIGPNALRLVSDPESVSTLAEVGVVLLLFGVGLELPLSRARELWRPTLLAGSAQVGLTGIFTYAAARGFGLSFAEAVGVAFVIVPSSTAIVLRGLEARGEIDAPHGRLMLGVLLFQDVCVVPMMLVLPALGPGAGTSGVELLLGLGKSVWLLGLVAVTSWIVAPRLLHLVALSRQRDVFVLAVLTVALGTAALAQVASVSLALGAFLAGIVVAGSDYRHQAMTDLIPFREVLAGLFFVSVGMLLDLRALAQNPGPVLGLTLGLLTGKLALMALAAAVLRLPLRVSMLASAGLAQVGEFGIVLLDRLGQGGVLPAAVSSMLLTAAILSMMVTPLVLAAGPRLAAGAERVPMMQMVFRARSASEARVTEGQLGGHVIIAGYGVAGATLARAIEDIGVRTVIVDLNPTLVAQAADAGLHAYYGDATSEKVLAHLDASIASELVVLVNDPDALGRIVKAARHIAPRLVISVRTRYLADAPALAVLGANHVVAAEVEAGRAIEHQVLARLQGHGVT